jgi:fatty-acyl-CoA synthase
MQTPLTPLSFARRARSLYGEREAVVDGSQRWSYAQFFDRCDRWSSALQRLGVAPGDRVAYIATNTHAHLEGSYGVPQAGAVIVPLNYRLLPADWVYLVNHSGSRVLCVHAGLPRAGRCGAARDAGGGALRGTGRERRGLARV